jgi:hypothetical protein
MSKQSLEEDVKLRHTSADNLKVSVLSILASGDHVGVTKSGKQTHGLTPEGILSAGQRDGDDKKEQE